MNHEPTKIFPDRNTAEGHVRAMNKFNEDYFAEVFPIITTTVSFAIKLIPLHSEGEGFL